MHKKPKQVDEDFVRSQIYAEQIRQLFVNARTAVIATFVNSVVLVYGFGTSYSPLVKSKLTSLKFQYDS